jgi:hypothetical protein
MAILGLPSIRFLAKMALVVVAATTATGTTTEGPFADDRVEPNPGTTIPEALDGDLRAALEKAVGNPPRRVRPEPLARRLVRLGVAVLKADLTRDGRHRWPHLWDPDGPHRPCCDEVEVYAANAAWANPAHTRVRVTLLWNGRRIGDGGGRISGRVTFVHLTRARGGPWRPTGIGT